MSLTHPVDTNTTRPACPQFFFRTTDVTGVTEVLGDADMCLPGEGVRLDVTLSSPVAFNEGDRFAIREGGRTVGSGVVTQLPVASE